MGVAADSWHPSAKLVTTLSDGRALGRDPKVTKSRRQSIDTEFATPLYHKTSVTDRYNELTLDMRGGYALQLRAYDDAAAYRFILRQSADSVTITDEQATFRCLCFGGVIWSLSGRGRARVRRRV